MADTRSSKSQILTFEQFKQDELKRDPLFSHDDAKVRQRFNAYLAQGQIGTDSVLKPNLPIQDNEEDPEKQRRRQGTIVTGFRGDTGTMVTGMRSGAGSRLGQ